MLQNGILSDRFFTRPNGQISVPLLIVGDSTAAYSATLGALQGGATVCLVQPQQVVGGQFTAQGLPASDDGKLVATQAGETFAISRSYRQFRQRQRELQKVQGKIVGNPGGGWVSHLCVTPVVAAHALNEALIEYLTQGQLTIIADAEPIEVLSEGQRRVTGVVFQDRQRGGKFTVNAQIVIEATDLGDLLELGKIKSRIGQESRHDTGEAVLPEEAYPSCQQAITFCAVVEKTPPGEGVPIDAPPGYDELPWLQAQDFTSTFWIKKPEQNPPWKRQDFFDDWGIFTYRRIRRSQAQNSARDGDVTVINWGTSPRGVNGALCCGNDYRDGVLVGVSREERQETIQRARDRAQAYVHFLQTQNIDLKPRCDLTWTPDGIALAPYIREARRGVALTTIRHEDVAQTFFGEAARARCFNDSVGIGQYHYLDFHPNHAHGHVNLGDGANTLPFTIPLGALIPISTDGLILSAKSIGTTHITNAAYRMHPVEWAIGEAGGHLAAFALQKGIDVRTIATDKRLTQQLQAWLARFGVPLFWFDDIGHDDPDFEAIQVLSVAGVIAFEPGNLRFNPEGKITRGEVAVAVVKQIGFELNHAHAFKDVSREHRAYESIGTLFQKGIVVGVRRKRFAPDQFCTREHLSIMISKLGFNVEPVFSDTPQDHQKITRRELARVLYRAVR